MVDDDQHAIAETLKILPAAQLDAVEQPEQAAQNGLQQLATHQATALCCNRFTPSTKRCSVVESTPRGSMASISQNRPRLADRLLQGRRELGARGHPPPDRRPATAPSRRSASRRGR